jgi:RND superfamily putative drug exporter
MTSLLYRLGRASVRRRRRVLLAWALVALAVIGLAAGRGGQTSDAFDVPGVESQQAYDLLESDFPAAAGTSAQLVFAAEGDGTLTDAAAAAAVDDALADVADQPHVGGVGELSLSDDARTGYVDVQYDRESEGIREEAFGRLEATRDAAADTGEIRMELGGDLPTEAVQDEPAGQEAVGVLVAVVVLLVAFGSVIAMGLPIGLALVGLATSLSLIGIVSSFADVNSVSPVLAAMIGLGVGIDYALFIVTRHRENLRLGMTVEEAAGRANATSGAAVLFAGATVVIAICGLAIAGIPAVTVMGLMAAMTVAVMVAISLTLLPAFLGFAGHRIDAIRVPGLRGGTPAPGRESLWHRWGRQVSAHPWRYLAGGVLVLGLLAAPTAAMRLGMTDNGVSPSSLTTRQAYDLVADGFGPGVNGPLLLAASTGDGGVADLEPLASAVAADPGVAAVAPISPNDDGTAAVLRVIPTTSPQDEGTTDLVHRLRSDVIPPAIEGTGADVYVGGQTATFIDLSDKISDRLPWFVGAVIGLSVVLLMMVFRSIAVPLKAAAMNLLSIGAAYGVIVAVFQWGWLKGLFGVEETVPIVSFMPMMLFAVLFGLSMDYEVFLLSRVREEYLHRRDNTVAVIEGISSTARVITSAALIMISVFAAFVLGDDPIIKMFGVGLATAVFLDATVVRVILVPATMRLLGDRNWWLPGWLDRLLPNLDVEGGVGLPEPEYEPGRGPVVGAGPASDEDDDADADVTREPALTS